MKYLLMLTGLLVWASCVPVQKPDTQSLIFVGTYTQSMGWVNGKASGIYTCRFDTVGGALQIIDSLTGIDNPSFIAISPDRRFLYSVSETGGGPTRAVGRVIACKIGPNGHLEKINDASTYGVGPCHVSTDRTGRIVFVANYGGGNIASYTVRSDGGLNDSASFVQHVGGVQPWAHQIRHAPDGSVVAVDKGADRVFRYTLSEDGRLKANGNFATPLGAGPRHLDFHPTQPDRFALINELSCTMLHCQRDLATGAVTVLDSISTLPDGFSGKNTCADVHYHPNGKFLYGSNRGHNSIVIYGIEPQSGDLQVLGHASTHGEVPRNFMVTPDGKWLLAGNQNSSTVAIYKIDAQTGLLTLAGQPSRVPTPVCLQYF